MKNEMQQLKILYKKRQFLFLFRRINVTIRSKSKKLERTQKNVTNYWFMRKKYCDISLLRYSKTVI